MEGGNATTPDGGVRAGSGTGIVYRRSLGMRSVKLVSKFVVAAAVSAALVIGAPSVASGDSTHICQGSRNCNDVDGGHGHGGGKGGKGHHNTENELECSNRSGDSLITIVANVCPQDFPILVNILS
jgi:hypothetical protein